MTQNKERIGFVGLGRMGLNLAENFLDNNISIAVYDISMERTALLKEKRKEDAESKMLLPSASLEELAGILHTPKTVWLMTPAGRAVDESITGIVPYLSKGDIIVDGGNSYFKDSMQRAAILKEMGIHFLDVGTSGGIHGARNGACLMIGGEYAAYKQLEPVFEKISQKNGFLYTGKSGSGHFVKMIHNLIEYGMEKCIGEGIEMIKAGEKIFDLPGFDIRKICRVWNNGSIIESRLVGFLAEALEKPDMGSSLENVSGYVGGGETGEWAVKTAMELGVPVPANATALFARYSSRQQDSLGDRCIVGMRAVFGEHEVKHKADNQASKDYKPARNYKI